MSPPPRLQGPVHLRVPEGDTHERKVCLDCHHICYENPRIIVGSVVTYEGRLLLCRRAIPPRIGFWTMPAGFLELQETPEDGAKREALEEAGARIELDGLLAVYTLAERSQVHLMYRATLLDPQVSPGIESQSLEFFSYEDVPWDELAFPSVHWALKDWFETKSEKHLTPRRNP